MKKLFYKLYFGKTNYDDVVFARNDFLRLVGAPNESQILIIVYYMFKYSVVIKKNFAIVTSEPKKYFKGCVTANYMDLVFARNDFLRPVGAQNECLIRIIIYYMFKYSVGIKTTLLESFRSQKIILQAIFRYN